MKNKLVLVELRKKNTVWFYRLQSDCESHKIENGGHGWCRAIGYKVRPYWYTRLKEVEKFLPTL